MAYEKAYWKISSRMGYNVHRSADFNEEDEPEFRTMAFVMRGTYGENPWSVADAIETITAIAQLRRDLSFMAESTDDKIILRCGSTGPAYKIEKMPPMQEVFRFD